MHKDNEDDYEYEFTNRWYPDITKPILEDTSFYAQYNYKATQTFALLNKTIKIIYLDTSIRKIPEFSFCDCTLI
jgi:hypothetical protein